MKFAAKTLLSLIALAATLAYAQGSGPNTPIKHIILVIQENRSPDNLFQDPNLVSADADIVSPQTGGKCWTQTYGEQTVKLAPLKLKNCTNPGHEHSDWNNMFHNGAMDGACTHLTDSKCNPMVPQYPCPFDPHHILDCSQYTYVENTPDPAVQPYWDVAEKYGFANYLFQTNQGPSLPAHQFLSLWKFRTRISKRHPLSPTAEWDKAVLPR
jgi:phospholipase C